MLPISDHHSAAKWARKFRITRFWGKQNVCPNISFVLAFVNGNEISCLGGLYSDEPGLTVIDTCLTNQSTGYRTQDESSATSSDPRYFSGLGRNANELSRTPGELSSFIVFLYYYFSNPRGMQNIHNLKTQIVRLKTKTSFLTSFTFLRSKRLQVVLTEGVLLSRENTTNEKLTN